MSKNVLVPIADGSEELEAVAIIDILRRAGANVTVASVNQLQITASRGVKITADCLISECQNHSYELIVLPGGMPGAKHFHDSDILINMLKLQEEKGRLYGAICASPAIVLQPHGLLGQRRATCHPGRVDALENKIAIDSRVVVDKNCVTSQGPGTSLLFALKLVELLYGPEKKEEIAGPLVM
jgi:protein deglycase